jgi:hypothetical protein
MGRIYGFRLFFIDRDSVCAQVKSWDETDLVSSGFVVVENPGIKPY